MDFTLPPDLARWQLRVREFVESLYADKTVTTRFPGALVSATYGEVLERSGRLAAALAEAGVRQGDRVATLAWNAQHHLELYLAVPCMGAVLHTINARLPAETIVMLLEQAEDRVLFADRSLLARLDGVARPAVGRHGGATHHPAAAPAHDKPAGGYEARRPRRQYTVARPEHPERHRSHRRHGHH